MYHPRVMGTYYEMGFKYGTVLYNHGFRVAEQSLEKLEFGRKSEKEVRRSFPEILEEIRGFADACLASYEHLSTMLLCIGAFKAEPMCSALAVLTDSDVIFGRNYDFFYSFKKYTEGYLTCPKEAYFSLGHSDVFIGREDGVNEKGLAISMTGVQSEGRKPGMSFVLAVRRVLDKCSSTREAVQFLSSIRHTSTFNFLLADKEADIAVVEAAPDKIRVRRPNDEEKFIVCTNHFAHCDMQDMEDLKARSKANWDSLPRYATISNALDRYGRKASVKNVQKILADHNGYVCSHQEKIKLGTLWSIVATLKKLQIFRAEGHPCKNAFKEDTRLIKAIQRRKQT
jgi:predicted choloylglycine hydrolase